MADPMGRLMFAALALALAACSAIPPDDAGEAVVTGTAWAPFGAVELCLRRPEEVRCQPTAE